MSPPGQHSVLMPAGTESIWAFHSQTPSLTSSAGLPAIPPMCQLRGVPECRNTKPGTWHHVSPGQPTLTQAACTHPLSFPQNFSSKPVTIPLGWLWPA